MKRTDLKVGDALYSAKPWQWDHHTGDKATVVAVEPYKANKARWGFRADPYKQVEAGNGVLVEMAGWGGKPEKQVVQLAHLRGPYDEIAAQVAAEKAEASAAREKADQARDDHQRFMAALRRRAKVGGYTVYSATDTDFLTIHASDLASLLDAAGVPQSVADMGNARTIANG